MPLINFLLIWFYYKPSLLGSTKLFLYYKNLIVLSNINTFNIFYNKKLTYLKPFLFFMSFIVDSDFGLGKLREVAL